MEHLSVNKNQLILHNRTPNKIEISLHNEEKAIIIEANSSLEVSVHSDNINLTVKEYEGEDSEATKLSEAILGFIISIPLLLINCISFETIDKSIELPVKFSLQCSNTENRIVINNSEEKLKGYILSLNDKYLSGETVYSQIEAERQINNYYYLL